MKIRDKKIDYYDDDYYPQKEKIRRKKPRRKDLDGVEEDRIVKKTKNK